jgi:uncharacterized Fe-S center protein
MDEWRHAAADELPAEDERIHICAGHTERRSGCMHRVRFTEALFTGESGAPGAVLMEACLNSFSPGDTVAVKLHMGEANNKTALSPAFVKGIVSALRSMGTRPFLFDSPVVYASRRNTVEGYLELARERGFTPDYIGCPVHVSNEGIPLKGEKAEYSLCRMLAEADGVCFVSHVKGHPCTGFGGAIKNIGMGAMSKETKGMIHDGGKPVYNCGCTQCMKCVEMCPTSNIRMNEDHPEFDATFCVGCSNCSLVCEEDAIQPAITHFDRMLAEATALALPHFGKLLFINCIINITKLCDCVSNSGKRLLDDVGFVLGNNICAVERASFDLIEKRAGRDIFFDTHHVSPLAHIDHLRSLLGESSEYSIREGMR